jgi:hypothetical protein
MRLNKRSDMIKKCVPLFAHSYNRSGYSTTILLLLLLTASGYVPGGSGTTIHNTKYNKILYNTQNNTYTLKTIHNAKITIVSYNLLVTVKL